MPLTWTRCTRCHRPMVRMPFQKRICPTCKAAALALAELTQSWRGQLDRRMRPETPDPKPGTKR
jgi:hypothetical protein